MKLYNVKSLKWSGTESYSFKEVYWKDNDNGYTTDINKAGIYTEDKVVNRAGRYNNGKTTEAILIEVEEISNEEYKKEKEELEEIEKWLEKWKGRYGELKDFLVDLEWDIRDMKKEVRRKEQGLRVQDVIKGSREGRVNETT